MSRGLCVMNAVGTKIPWQEARDRMNETIVQYIIQVEWERINEQVIMDEYMKLYPQFHNGEEWELTRYIPEKKQKQA